ncbi:glycosyltransferase family 4 protein [Rhodococcus sp. NPDC057014]|uniref:glycosyltransferase family 4 protein n=1 Tax=Rhodococcus sp. NPDC057014 TaxID=3346000 RepID=UPI0036420796
MTRLVINGGFRPQRITGQQRYASEIANRLSKYHGFREVRPNLLSGTRSAEWAWTQLSAITTRNDILLSLTARAPVLHPSHVVVVHDLFVITNPEWYSRKYSRTHAPLQRVQMQNAKELIAVSAPIAKQIEQLGLNRGKVSVAPNAPSEAFSSISTDADHEVLDRFKISDGEYFLTVGSLDPRKNLARLVKSYERYRAQGGQNFPLLIVGSNSDIFGNLDINWPADAIRVGYVSDSDLAALYRGSTGVIFPSLAEGFGLPAIEALESGARLAVSDIDVFRWVCGSNADYFDPLDEVEIAQAFTRLVEAQEITGDQDLNKSGSVSRTFSWTDSAQIIADVCRNLSMCR